MRTVLRVKVVGVGGVVAKHEFRVDSLAHGPRLIRWTTGDCNARPVVQFTNLLAR
jgi:hypothetical protein